MAVIDVTHKYNWDIAQRFQDKRQPVKDKDLKAAIEEANKAAEGVQKRESGERTNLESGGVCGGPEENRLHGYCIYEKRISWIHY